MQVPLSWLKDYVDVDLPIEELARVMTMAGMEVEAIQVVGLPMPEGEKHEFKISGLSWPEDKFVVAQINEVLPHPDADRLILCKLDDGQGERTVLTGAPNLYEYKGTGPLDKPLKVAYARLGSVLYDGHKPGWELTKLKKARIRGVVSDSMVCSEKELGISEEHEGVIILDDDAPTGMPLAEYMGDVVYTFEVLPNMVRDACIVGVAREIAAVLDKPLRQPQLTVPVTGPSVEGQAFIEITDPNLNPRFVLGLVKNVEARPSPYWVQRRLRLAGTRPINSIIDATNYCMLEVNEPLHSFDYDVLVKRAGGKAPTIITRSANPGESLVTLDDVEHKLEPYTILVTDTAGALSLAGIMGGLESEVTPETNNVLLEAANWNFINVRKTMKADHLSSEAGYRFSRDLHPELAPKGVRLGLDRIALWSGGEIAEGLVDVYPKPYEDPVVEITGEYVERSLGIHIPIEMIVELLTRLEFECRVEGQTIFVKSPDHRTDIGRGVIGKADVLEEVARLYGFDNIPASRIADELPPQRRNESLEREERLRDVLARLGLQEIITYRFTTPEAEERLVPPDVKLPPVDYVRLANPIAADRTVLRRTLLNQMLEVVERNVRQRPHLALFEVGAVFLPIEGELLPAEPRRLALAMTGQRFLPAWDQNLKGEMDFFDLKGVVESMLAELHIEDVTYAPGEHTSFHPGKCANVWRGDVLLGTFGELHPLVKERFDLEKAPVLAAELDVEALLRQMPMRFETVPVPVYPPVLEDLAVVVDEATPAAAVLDVIRKAGGKLLEGVFLFDIFRGPQIGAGKKSLAYSLIYRSPDKTLSDKDTKKLRKKVIYMLEKELDAKLRS
ncbi:MAG: phenylalanine--tRNA ligase subunit beta [Anaerolineaceae bacterium]|nr:phenylalanine--tRNA ligase subunit beta [Anaerolineaceae bacterium]